MKDIKLEDVLPLTARQYFSHFIETPDAKYQYLLSKGHSDVEVGEWIPCSGEGVYERVSNFSTNLSNNVLVKKLTGSVSLKIQETQRYYFENQDDLHVESTMTFGGSSIAESFSSRVEWTIHTLPNSHSEVKCNVKTEYRGFMFKGLIEKYVHQAACDSFHHWLKAVREKLAILQAARPVDNVEIREDEDQSVPTMYLHTPPVTDTETNAEESEDDADDDQFFDSLDDHNEPRVHNPTSDVAHPRSAPSSRSTSPTSSPAFSYAPNTFSSHSSTTQAIFASYTAGRMLQQQQQQTKPAASISTLTLTRNPPQQANPKEIKEKYKKQLAELRAQHKEKEREWEDKLSLMAGKIDLLARNQRRFLSVVLAFLCLFWPVLARKLWKFLLWLWPMMRKSLSKR